MLYVYFVYSMSFVVACIYVFQNKKKEWSTSSLPTMVLLILDVWNKKNTQKNTVIYSLSINRHLNILRTVWHKLGMHTNWATENREYGHRVHRQYSLWWRSPPVDRVISPTGGSLYECHSQWSQITRTTTKTPPLPPSCMHEKWPLRGEQ